MTRTITYIVVIQLILKTYNSRLQINKVVFSAIYM